MELGPCEGYGIERCRAPNAPPPTRKNVLNLLEDRCGTGMMLSVNFSPFNQEWPDVDYHRCPRAYS